MKNESIFSFHCLPFPFPLTKITLVLTWSVHKLTNSSGQYITDEVVNKAAHEYSRDLAEELISQTLCVLAVLQQQVSMQRGEVSLNVDINEEVADDGVTHEGRPDTMSTPPHHVRPFTPAMPRYKNLTYFTSDQWRHKGVCRPG